MTRVSGLRMVCLLAPAEDLEDAGLHEAKVQQLLCLLSSTTFHQVAAAPYMLTTTCCFDLARMYGSR